MTETNNIEFLYNQIKDKNTFIKSVAKEFGKRPNTLRHHWFAKSGFFCVPMALEDKVTEFMQRFIVLEKQKQF